MRDGSHAGQLDFNTNSVQNSVQSHCFLVAFHGVVSGVLTSSDSLM